MIKFAKCLYVALAALAAACSSPPVGCVVDPPRDIGGPLRLLDERGAPATERDFGGRPALVYFGFTYCPDVCPLAMQYAKATLEAAGRLGARVQPILISLDPERDTPQAMARYISNEAFPAGLRGLTGAPADTAAAAKAFKVGWRKSGDGPDYTIDHTSFFYVLGPDWEILALYPSDLDPASAAQCLQLALK